MGDLTYLGRCPADNPNSEECLIARYVTTGDELAFKTVYDRYREELISFVHHHLEGTVAAGVDNMLQQASCDLHCCRNQLLRGTHVRLLLYRIVEHHCNDYIEAETRKLDYRSTLPCSHRMPTQRNPAHEKSAAEPSGP